MQILHRFAGSIERYSVELSNPDRYRPDHCPQREAHRPLRAHGLYTRTLADIAFDGTIRLRRYLCCSCKRTVSLLPEFSLPYLRFGIMVIALFLVARLLFDLTLNAAAESAKLAAMPYQRGQFWVRRFGNKRKSYALPWLRSCPASGAPLYIPSPSDVGVESHPAMVIPGPDETALSSTSSSPHIDYEAAFARVHWERTRGELSRKLCLSAALSDPRVSESS
jgi:hypothetical protein